MSVFRAPWLSKFNVRRLIFRAHQQISWVWDWAWLTVSANLLLPYFLSFSNFVFTNIKKEVRDYDRIQPKLKVLFHLAVSCKKI